MINLFFYDVAVVADNAATASALTANTVAPNADMTPLGVTAIVAAPSLRGYMRKRRKPAPATTWPN